MTATPPSLPRAIRRTGSALAAGAALLLLAGCATQGLAFRTDNRVDIVSPGSGDEVTVPFTVRWTAEDIGGSFAVFVDRTPQPPGKPLSWLTRDDDGCDASRGCPDAEYLAQRGVYTTTEHRVVVDRVPPADEGRRCKEHEAVVVLLDDAGRRRGESAWAVPFRVCRPR